MNIWKAHIESGNEYFRNEVYNLAEDAYIQACGRAEKLFHHWFDAEEIVAATTISYFSLADCLKCQGQYQSAQVVLEKIHHLIATSLSETNKNSGRYLALLKGQNKAHIELQQFLKIIDATDEGAANSFGVSC